MLLEAVTFLYRHHEIDPTELGKALSGVAPHDPEKPKDTSVEGPIGYINQGWNEAYLYLKRGAGF